MQAQIDHVQADIRSLTSNKMALRCLIGTSLYKFGSGLIVLWGQINIYVYSYFY